jgi:hypothetical protein
MAARRQNCFAALVSRADSRTSKFPAASCSLPLGLPVCLVIRRTWAPAGACVADRAAQEIIEWRASFCTRDMFLDSDTDADGQGRDRALFLSLLRWGRTRTGWDGMGWVHIVHGI